MGVSSQFLVFLVSNSTAGAELTLAEINGAGNKYCANRRKTQFMKYVYCEEEGIQLDGSQLTKTS